MTSRGRGRARILLVLALVLAVAVGFATCRRWTTASRYRPLRIASLVADGAGPEGAAATAPAAADTAAPATDRPPTLSGYSWRGAVHVHTELSPDATGTLAGIVAAAEAAELDFIIVSDHTRAMGAAGRAQGGWYGSVLVIVSEEVSTSGGHLLALGVPAHRYALGPEPLSAIADVVELGGWAVVAHPFGGEVPWRGAWGGAEGVEVASMASALYTVGWRRIPGVLFDHLANPAYAALRIMAGRQPSLAAWDELTRLGRPPHVPRRAVGIGSVDAHGPRAELGRVRFPDYQEPFQTLTTVVWMDEPPRPEEGNARVTSGRLLERLREGRAAVIVDAVGNAPLFTFTARRPRRERRVHPGQAAAWREGVWTVAVDLGGPGSYRVELLRDGERIAHADGGLLEMSPPGPGTYRAEVFRLDGPPGAGSPGDAPWIISNPIYLWPDEMLSAGRIFPAPPVPPPPLGEDLLHVPGWTAEASPETASFLGLGDGGLTWSFRLSTRSAQDSYAALVWRPEKPVDWTALGGIGLHLTSSETLRLRLQLRTGEPGDAGRLWQATLRSTGDGADNAIPWSALHEVGPDGQARQPGIDSGAVLDALSRVRSVALLVTPTVFRPGVDADVEVKALGLFDGI